MRRIVHISNTPSWSAWCLGREQHPGPWWNADKCAGLQHLWSVAKVPGSGLECLLLNVCSTAVVEPYNTVECVRSLPAHTELTEFALSTPASQLSLVQCGHLQLLFSGVNDFSRDSESCTNFECTVACYSIGFPFICH